MLLTADADFSPLGSGDSVWGFLRVWDVMNPAAPVEVGQFQTPNSLSGHPDDGEFSIHNPFVRGSTVYRWWYSDGVRVADISQPSAPREIAFFVPPGFPHPFGILLPAAEVWGV